MARKSQDKELPEAMRRRQRTVARVQYNDLREYHACITRHNCKLYACLQRKANVKRRTTAARKRMLRATVSLCGFISLATLTANIAYSYACRLRRPCRKRLLWSVGYIKGLKCARFLSFVAWACSQRQRFQEVHCLFATGDKP